MYTTYSIIVTNFDYIFHREGKEILISVCLFLHNFTICLPDYKIATIKTVLTIAIKVNCYISFLRIDASGQRRFDDNV